MREIEEYNCLHWPFRSWCPHCVAGRRPNAQHRRQLDASRKIPLFCADYCYVRDEHDEDLLTVMVGKLYPSKALFASACDVKGPDDAVVVAQVADLGGADVFQLVA